MINFLFFSLGAFVVYFFWSLILLSSKINTKLMKFCYLTSMILSFFVVPDCLCQNLYDYLRGSFLIGLSSGFIIALIISLIYFLLGFFKK